MELELHLNDIEDTERLGKILGRNLPPDAICLFRGDLAAGKTTLIKRICAEFSIEPKIVISPTYTISNWYQGDRTVFHVDFYRLNSSEDLSDLDQGDWLNPDGPTFIEWPDVAMPLLGGMETLLLCIEPIEGDEEARRVSISSDGAGYIQTFAALSQEFGCHQAP